MRRISIGFALIALATLAGCQRGQAPVDIVSIERQPAPPAGVGVELRFAVRAGQFRSLLDQSGTIDLRIEQCGAPEGPGDQVPVLFGGEQIANISTNQVVKDPDTLVQLTATVSARAAALPDRCVHLVEASGRPVAPIVTSKQVKLPAA